MKNARKILRIVLLVIIVLVVSIVVLIHLFGNRALRIGIEAAGTKTLNVGVSVEDVDLSILGGKVVLQNLLVNNPPGYQHKQLLELESAQIKVRVKSLLSDVVNIKDIKLDGMTVVLEQRGISGNNLQDVIKSIPSKDKQGAEPSGKKLHIDNLEISDVTVKVKLLSVVPGTGDTIPLKLRPIKMTNLGSDNKLDAAVLAGKILVAIAGGIAEQGVGVLPDEIINPLKGELKRLGALSGALLKEGGKILKEGKELGKGVGGVLEGLVKPKKKEE
jgi:hypothetical protein